MSNSPAGATSTLTFVIANARWLLGGLCLTVFSSFGQTFYISLFAAEIRAEFSLSHGDFGGLYMLGTLASALTLVLIGKVADHYTVKWLGIAVCIALAIACALMSFSQSWIGLLFTIFTLRLFGQGMMTHVAMTAMGRWYSQERGRAVSITTVGHQIGEGILPLLAVFFVGLVGWRYTWLLASASLLMIAAPLLFVLMRSERTPRGKNSQSGQHLSRQWTRGEVLRDRLFWVTTAGILAPAFIGTSFFFHQVHVADTKQWPLTIIASGFSVMALTTLIFALSAGWLIDRFSARQLLSIPLIPLGFACWLLSSFDSAGVLFGFMFFLGLSYGFSSSIFGALWPEVYGVKHLGAIRSMVMAMMVFSSALGPGVTGWLIDRGTAFDTQLLVMAGYCLVGALIMSLASHHYQRRHGIQSDSNPAKP
ncbi:MAG: MFS transporter [Gammaproteobacteria bacterium]|nr:MFS transporter [Gammaproteobacteria bacterium]